ncbi:MAG TPA: protein-disulfide reductase DsbD, partial [Herminiimonas sp.]|nr:protein-disulfide reductase DsbD [Herminiimonas sp.]
MLACACLFSPQAHAADNYLSPDQAFKFSARMRDAKTIAITYDIADGYYMYRERFKFAVQDAKAGVPVIPPGKVKFDQIFNKNVETYHRAITILLPVEANGVFTVVATGQGCADKGLCYPPMTSEVRLSPTDLIADDASQAQQAFTQNSSSTPPSSAASDVEKRDTSASETGAIEAALKSGKLLAILPLFLLLGLGLSLTPCVLPMVPILSTIIVGEGAQAGRWRGLLLSVAYSIGMALVYTALGVAAGLIGEGLSAALQNPWVLTAFAGLMVILSLSMFNVYQLQVPPAIQLRLMQVSGNQAAGKLIGVFAMGALSALIVGPCVAAPLAGALVYISQTRDVVTGGSALFAMASGMSVPLLLVGVSAGTLLPRAGIWMETVKQFFGVLMLAMALWMVTPLLPAWSQMLAWAIIGIAYGIFLLQAKNSGRFAWVCGVTFALLGALQLIGAVSGASDPLAPLARLTGSEAEKVEFMRIKTVAQLDSLLAKTDGKKVMLDFYADWCVSCKEMEKFTFSDQRVKKQLEDMLVLQVDVTANDVNERAMLKKFNLFGPPGIIFFDGAGHEVQD